MFATFDRSFSGAFYGLQIQIWLQIMNAALQKITMRGNYLMKESLKLINSEPPQTEASILALIPKYQQAPVVCQVSSSLLESEDMVTKKKDSIMTFKQLTVQWMNSLTILAFTERFSCLRELQDTKKILPFLTFFHAYLYFTFITVS